MSCLSIQNRVDFYCSLQTPRDIYTLQEQLQTPKNQDNAESVHLLLHSPRVIRNKSTFNELMQLIGQLPHLTDFSISMLHSRKLPASTLALLLREATHLEGLHLEDLCLEGSPYELAEVLKHHPTLHTIQLLRCYCSPVHVLLQALARMPHLYSLCLDGSVLAQQRDADAKAALGSVCCSKSLQRLELTGIEERSMTESLVVMMDALQQQPHAQKVTPPSLSELSLRLAPLETMPLVVVRAIARMLVTNTSLHTIIVPWTGGGEVWLPIIDALALNNSLEEFRLHPGPKDAHCLSHPFLQRAAATLREHNTHLKHFWYDNWEDIDLEIDLYMISNNLGRGHLVYEEVKRPTYDEWVSAVVSSRDHVHVTNYWLSQNPALLVTAIAKVA